MSRSLNLILVLVVVVCGFSLWLAQGRPLPDFLERDQDGDPVKLAQIEHPPLEPVHLRILNATEKAGLAGEMAVLVTRLGCVVEGVGNAPQWPGSETVLINRRLVPAQIEVLAARLGAVPVIREWDGRTTEDAVLVLGADTDRVKQVLLALRD